MTVKRWIRVALFSASLAGAISLMGCDTPSARIRKNPQLFNSFPPDIQEKIRQGKVEMGFTRDMVYMALGEPDVRYLRRTKEGSREVWAYTVPQQFTERRLITGPFRYRTADGEYRTIRERMWVDVEQRQDVERLRVEFENGRVVAIEEMVQGTLGL